MEAWIDGSRQLLETEEGKKALFVGAGAVSAVPELNFEFQVTIQLERGAVKGEMAWLRKC